MFFIFPNLEVYSRSLRKEIMPRPITVLTAAAAGALIFVWVVSLVLIGFKSEHRARTLVYDRLFSSHNVDLAQAAAPAGATWLLLRQHQAKENGLYEMTGTGAWRRLPAPPDGFVVFGQGAPTILFHRQGVLTGSRLTDYVLNPSGPRFSSFPVGRIANLAGENAKRPLP